MQPCQKFSLAGLYFWGTIYLTFLTPMDCGFSLWATATDCGWEVKYIDPYFCLPAEAALAVPKQTATE
jgi:hypothetical protein